MESGTLSRDTAWAMSQENVDLVRRLLDMFARRDHEGVFEFYDPDIEWDATAWKSTAVDTGVGGVAGLAGVYRGHEGVRTYWRRWFEAVASATGYSVLATQGFFGGDATISYLIWDVAQWRLEYVRASGTLHYIAGGTNTNLFSIDGLGNVIAKGTITASGSPVVTEAKIAKLEARIAALEAKV